MRHRLAIFLSKALKFDRCAAWHRARALRNTVWMRVSHPADSARCSTDRPDSDFASMRSWYGIAVMKGDTARALQGLPGLQALVHYAQKADGRCG